MINAGHDSILTESDIICFTETQIHSSVAPKRSLEKLEMIYNNNEDKFKSLAIGFRIDVSIVTDTNLNGASIIEFVKPEVAFNLQKNSVTLTSYYFGWF